MDERDSCWEKSERMNWDKFEKNSIVAPLAFISKRLKWWEELMLETTTATQQHVQSSIIWMGKKDKDWKREKLTKRENEKDVER